MASPLEPARYDIFLSYHSADSERVRAFSRLLKEQGIPAFLDRDNLIAGSPWPNALEQALRSVRAVVVFVGKGEAGESLGLWQRREAWFALDRQAQSEAQGESFPVIPVLLPGARPDAGFLFLNTWVDLRNAGDEPAAVHAIVHALGASAIPTATAWTVAVCPYRALEAFREEHTALFFGRESFADALLDRVANRPLVALIGPSGSGKSSVVQAGLIPLLRRQRPPQRAWDAVLFRPGGEPFQRLATALMPLLEPDADEVDRLELVRKLGEKLSAGAVRIEDVIARLIAKSNGTDRLLIVADQFEELFTSAPAEQRSPFATALLDALEKAPFTLLLVLRADFYAHAIGLDRRLSDHIQSGLVNLGPMTRDELRRTVEQPAGKVGIRFEAGLVDRVLDHVERQPGGLPLLEFALTQLWEKCDGARITHAAYEAIGEVEGAISQRAESVFQGLDTTRQRAALSLFTRLLRVAAPNEAEPDTRRRVQLDALTQSEHAVLQPFVDARLLVLGRGESAHAQSVEVAHEALIHGWRRLGEWVDQQREFLLWRQRLGQSAGEWDRSKRDESLLLRGSALKEAAHWAEQRGNELSRPEAEFVGRSRRKERGRRRRLGLLIAIPLLILAAWPGLRYLSNTNLAQVWESSYLAPMHVLDARPSSIAKWVHTMDVAGRLGEIGSTFLTVPPPRPRLITLWRAAAVLSYEGRSAEAQRLADRAIEVAKQVPGFDVSGQGQAGMAEMLSQVGRTEQARVFALRALMFERQQPNAELRAHGLANAARVLAKAGMGREAREALAEARASMPEVAPPGSQMYLDDLAAIALINLGAVDEALKITSSRSRWLWEPLVQELVDHGHLEQARTLVAGSENPIAAAVLASAFASAGRLDEAKVLARRTVALLERQPSLSDGRDRARAQLGQQLLLKVMTPSEAVALVKERNNPDELASFAVVLVKAGQSDLARRTALDAARALETIQGEEGRARVRMKLVEVAARTGDADNALVQARTIELPQLRAVALAHAANGFALEGRGQQAQSLVAEVTESLRSIQNSDQQSLVWGTLAMASIQLGNYAAASHDEGLLVSPDDQLSVYAAIVQADALRRNDALRTRFERGPSEGLGTYGLHWP